MHLALKAIVYLHCHIIAWHFQDDLDPQLSHDATCVHVPFLWKMFVPLAGMLYWCLFTFMVCDAWCVHDMCVKMRSSNGCPKEQLITPRYLSLISFAAVQQLMHKFQRIWAAAAETIWSWSSKQCVILLTKCWVYIGEGGGCSRSCYMENMVHSKLNIYFSFHRK